MCDVILQTVSQVAAHRLAAYASSSHLGAIPTEKGFCDGVKELGTCKSDFMGPCLVLLQNCNATLRELADYVSGSFLRGYVVRIYWCEYMTTCRQEMVCHIKNLVDSLQLRFCDSRSIHLLHISDKGNQSHGPCDLQHYSKIKLRFQTFPRKLACWLIDQLPDVDCALHGFTHSLYAVEIDGILRYGIGKGADMYLTACDREALSKGFVGRACSKLEEALYVKGIKLLQHMVVLDVGAAPGAWTEFLSRGVEHVISVDPGKLSSTLGTNVTHICRKAEDACAELTTLLKERQLDLLVCDVNKHPVEAAQIVASLLVFLNPGSSLILTLKFHGRGRDKDSKVMEIKAMFQDSLKDMDCIWLLANSIYERTFVGVKK
eukprot:c47511_g1_i1 orf=146-1270(-)